MTDKANTIATWLGIAAVVVGTVFAGGQLNERFEFLQSSVNAARAVITKALQSTTQQETIDYLRHVHKHICAQMEEEGKVCTLPEPAITPPMQATPQELQGKE